VVFIGKAQEKTPIFRTERWQNEKTGATYPLLVRSTAMVNHFYLYCLDHDFGPFFPKFSTYFPYNAKHIHRYQLTQDRLRIALFFSRTYERLLRPKLAEIMPSAPPLPSPLRAAFDRLNSEIDACCEDQRLAA
jgi:hypothetical protein